MMSQAEKLICPWAILFWIWLTSLPAFGQDALQIQGPEQVESGTLVRLRGELDPEDSPFWIVLQPIDLDYEQVDDGKRLLFAARCDQRSDIVVLLLAQRVQDGRIVTRQVRKRIEIRPRNVPPGDDAPGDLPGDDAPPNLDQDPVYQVVAAAMNELSEATRRQSPTVAANFRQVARQCQAGEIGDIPAIWLTLSRLNRQTLGAAAQAWEPVGTALQREFQRSKLSTPAEHARPLLAAALAIEQGAIR